MTTAREHWESVYQNRPSDQVSWYRPHLEQSLRFIEAATPGRDGAIIDVGGGASTLVDDLLDRGYTNVTVLDVSARSPSRAFVASIARAETSSTVTFV